MLMATAQFETRFWLVIVAVIFAGISAYYYFRVIQAMYFKEATEDNLDKADIRPTFKLLLLVSVLIIIILGVYPEVLLGWMYH